MKNMFKLTLFSFIALLFIVSCNSSDNEKKTEAKQEQENQTIEKKEIVNNEAIDADFVILKTEYGNMKIKLYDETPKHKANFLKLIKSGFYKDLLFHRVIKDFMIQGGDPESKNAKLSAMLGSGGPGYQIDAEFNKKYFHKKGALAAAREGDQINPLKKSSGSQFYIVQGQKYRKEQIASMAEQAAMNNYILSHTEIKNKLTTLQQSQDREGIDKLITEVKNKKDFKVEEFSDEKIKIYTEIGGTPFLDNAYTVFGEVVEGLDVIDKIASVKTMPGDRPNKDIKMDFEIIKK